MKRQLEVAKLVDVQFKEIDEKMNFMTNEFDSFRIRITAQYIELTRHTLAKIQKDQVEMTEVVKHISDTFSRINWQIVNDAQDILSKGQIVV
jgi:hypothetical protein